MLPKIKNLHLFRLKKGISISVVSRNIHSKYVVIINIKGSKNVFAGWSEKSSFEAYKEAKLKFLISKNKEFAKIYRKISGEKTPKRGQIYENGLGKKHQKFPKKTKFQRFYTGKLLK